MRSAMVIGAHGFLGGFIAAALRARGWRVIDGVRKPGAGTDERMVDLTCTHVVANWRAILRISISRQRIPSMAFCWICRWRWCCLRPSST